MERNDMKTIAFTMALATLVLATAADADAQDRRCKGPGRGWGTISVSAGTPCVFGMGGQSALTYAAFIQSVRSLGMMLYSTEIIERPHNGTAVFQAGSYGGTIYYSPKPGFTGRDSIRVRFTGCNYSGTWHADPLHDWCGHVARTYSILVE
jgi:hypothetical protein